MNKIVPVTIDQWPALDRELWLTARQPTRSFKSARRAAKWRPDTVRMAEEGYGLYLAWLHVDDILESDQRPIDRVDADRVKRFIEFYREGRAELTVAMAVRAVAYVLRAIHGPDGLPWLNKLAHHLMNTAEPAKQKTSRMATLAELLGLGDRLMEQGRVDLEQDRRSGAQTFRDGLMIASLASCPLRRSNFAALAIDKTFFVSADRARASFAGKATKTGRLIEVEYPPYLVEQFHYYLAKARPILCDRMTAPEDGLLWIGRRGRPMTVQQITSRVSILTERGLGRMISPHLFRDCVTTDIAIHDPANVSITKSILGHARLATSQKFYNQAGSFEASRKLRLVIQKRRKAS
jgi:site-specific recombinase XerD